MSCEDIKHTEQEDIEFNLLDLKLNGKSSVDLLRDEIISSIGAGSELGKRLLKLVYDVEKEFDS